MPAKQITIAEMEQRIAEAEQDTRAALYLANRHREESVQLRQQNAELAARVVELEVELQEATELLGHSYRQQEEVEHAHGK